MDDHGCTGLSARWCPIHGDCTCPDQETYTGLDDPMCPLHGDESPHPNTATGPAPTPDCLTCEIAAGVLDNHSQGAFDAADALLRGPLMEVLTRDAARWRALIAGTLDTNDPEITILISDVFRRAAKWDALGLPDDTDPADIRHLIVIGYHADRRRYTNDWKPDHLVALARYIEEQG